MRSLDNCAWLRLVGGGAGPRVHYEGRFRHLTDGLPSVRTQFPGLVMLMGRRRKDAALKQLFPENQVGPTNQGINIRVDNTTQDSDYPVFFADGDPHLRVQDAGTPSAEVTPIDWATSRDHDTQDIFISRLLFVFADVVCIFADDVGGTEGVTTLLAAWATYGSASSLPPRPRIIVVLGTEGFGATGGFLERADLVDDLVRLEGVAQSFASVRVLVLPSKHLSPQAQYRPLKDEVKKGLDLARRDRRENSALFSAVHLNALFEKALHRRCRSRWTEFDFIRASREGNELPPDYAANLALFISLTKHIPFTAQTAFVASSMLMDAFPPKMHHFNPVAVFQGLYQDSLRQAIETASGSHDDRESYCRQVGSDFVALYGRFIRGCGPTRRIHRRTMKNCRRWLADVRTNRLCLICLRRRPQPALLCHSWCDVCVELFGEPVEGGESKYRLDSCVLCLRRQTVHINLLPRTAPVRAIAIDGGGVRGAMPLQKLVLIQDVFGADFPVSGLADVVIGSSIGGPIGVETFMLDRDPRESMAAYRDWAKTNFPPRKFTAWSILSLMAYPPWLVKVWLKDGLYETRGLDSMLKRRCGPERRMFDPMPRSGTKVAVTTVATTTGTPVLLANYRTVEGGERGYGYIHSDAEDASKEPLLWQCARATCAAPGLFRTIYLEAVGDSCEDGALKYPNPSALCRSEAPHMWPWEPEVAVLLSLGTGVADSAKGPSAAPRRSGNKFPFRLYRSFMSNDGESAWQALMGQLDEETRRYCFRMNTLIPGGDLPALNSAEDLDHMIGLVHITADDRHALTCFLAASLFFELSSRDEHDHCVGSVRCRFEGQKFIDAFTRLEPSSKEFWLNGEKTGHSLSADAVCDTCGRCCLPLRFSLRNKDDLVRLALNIEGRNIRLGPPRSARWLFTQQGLDASFGTANHGMPSRVGCHACQTRIRRREHARDRPQMQRRSKRVRFAI